MALEKSLLPYITANRPNTRTQNGYKTQYYILTALHTLNNTVVKGFNQMAPCARIITVAHDLSKAFDTINIHTLIRNHTLFNSYTAGILPPRAPVQVMAYADDITITSTHTSTSAERNTYNHTYIQFLSARCTTLHYPWRRTQRFHALP